MTQVAQVIELAPPVAAPWPAGGFDWPAMASGAPGVASFGAVSAACPADLTPTELPDLIVATDRLISHLHAVQVAAVAEFSLPGRAGSIEKLIDALVDKTGLTTRADGTTDDFAVQCLIVERAQSMAAAEIGAALHQSPIGASRRVADAVELVDQLPATLAALRQGRIDLPRAQTIAQRTAGLTPDLRTRVETAVLPLAASRTPGQLIPLIDRRVIAADPLASKKRAIAARRDRFVDHSPWVDGMGMIRAHLPAEGAVTVYDLLDRIARATAGVDDRPIAARRADALTDICTQLLTDGYVHVGNLQHPSYKTAAPTPDAADAADPVAPKVRLSKVSTQQGRGAHFNVTMTLAAFTQFNSDPAELTGHGIIPAHIGLALKKSIRSLAVIITNPDGYATAVGATTYLPRQLIRDQVITAAGTCRFPSCRIPGTRADLDHRIPFNHRDPTQGGHTAADCLDPECRHHHLIRTFTNWTPVRDPIDGLTMNWTSPTHHHYQNHPKEHALPESEQTPPDTDAGTDTGTGTGTGTDTDNDNDNDPDAPIACTCTCGHGNPADQHSTARTHAEQAMLLIAKKRQQQLEADELAEQQRLFLSHPPRWVHYIGPTPRPWPTDDRTDEQHNAEVQDYINSFDSYDQYKAADRKLNARIKPALYAIQKAQDYKLAHPDPNEPPF